VAELIYNCDRLLEAWNQLRLRISQGDQALALRPDSEVVARWDYVERMLIHAVRIDRILQAPRGDDEPWSWQMRQELATEIGSGVNLSLPQRYQIRRARNAVEHADEKLPNFIIANPGKALGSISVGPEADQGSRRNFIPWRAVNTLTWDGVVNGERVNLRDLAEVVREVKFGLPGPGTSPRLTPYNVPGDGPSGRQSSE